MVLLLWLVLMILLFFRATAVDVRVGAFDEIKLLEPYSFVDAPCFLIILVFSFVFLPEMETFDSARFIF
jgi:hypothetical protein